MMHAMRMALEIPGLKFPSQFLCNCVWLFEGGVVSLNGLFVFGWDRPC
jgi:hypothetical protein